MPNSQEIKDKIIELVKSNKLDKLDLIKIFSQLLYEGIYSNEEVMLLFEEIRDYFNLQTLESYRNRKDRINPVTGEKYSYNWINGLKCGDLLSVNKKEKILFTVICGKKFYVDND